MEVFFSKNSAILQEWQNRSKTDQNNQESPSLTNTHKAIYLQYFVLHLFPKKPCLMIGWLWPQVQ